MGGERRESKPFHGRRRRRIVRLNKLIVRTGVHDFTGRRGFITLELLDDQTVKFPSEMSKYFVIRCNTFCVQRKLQIDRFDHLLCIRIITIQTLVIKINRFASEQKSILILAKIPVSFKQSAEKGNLVVLSVER